MLTIGIYAFDEVEVLDFAGPFEVFSTASRVASRLGRGELFRVVVLGNGKSFVRARGGLIVGVHHPLESSPKLDVLIVPGGDVTAELRERTLLDWIASTAPTTLLTASVCTGAFLLAAAGLLDGKLATTHWEDLEDLRRSFPAVRVESGPRWLDEGRVVTSSGISAGLDMSLYLVARIAGREIALATARQMDYRWLENPSAPDPANYS